MSDQEGTDIYQWVSFWSCNEVWRPWRVYKSEVHASPRLHVCQIWGGFVQFSTTTKYSTSLRIWDIFMKYTWVKFQVAKYHAILSDIVKVITDENLKVCVLVIRDCVLVIRDRLNARPLHQPIACRLSLSKFEIPLFWIQTFRSQEPGGQCNWTFS